MAKKRRSVGLFGLRVDEAGDQELVRVARLALRLARRHLSDYSHEKSPKKYTQPQLFACLIVKAHLRSTCRRCEELLIFMPAVREALGLFPGGVPRFTTLQAFSSGGADRPDILALVDGVLASIGWAVLKARPQDAAIDGTGLETTGASAHLVSRAGRKRTRFVKLTLIVPCAGVIPSALVVDWGPSHDMKQAWALREKMKAVGTPTTLWGDGAFDSEAWRIANLTGWGAGTDACPARCGRCAADA